jgi:ribosomal protein L17
MENTNKKFISRTEMQTILNGRPKGAEIKPILEQFSKMGYTIEGFNDNSATSTNPVDQNSLSSKIDKRVQDVKTDLAAPTTLPEKALRVTGDVAGMGVDTINKVFENTVMPISNAINKAIDAGQIKLGLAKPEDFAKRDQMISDMTNGVITKYDDFKTQYPNLAKDSEAVFNIASMIPVAKVGTSAVKGTANATIKTAKATKDAIQNTAEGIKDVTGGMVKNIKTKTGDVIENVKINRVEKAKQNAIVESLGSETKKSAARSGIELSDINTIGEFDKKNIPAIQKMVQMAEDVQNGKTGIDPLDVVGEPIRKRVLNLNERADEIGKKLGETARNLKDVKYNELEKNVLGRLQKVSGLRGLKIVDRLDELGNKVLDTKGDPIKDLDFSETTLMSRANKAEREAIQTAFEEATRSGTGVSKHLYRQELFEILDGKKKSLSTLTDTQEKALDAIRGGLSDVLESKNKGYKDLSNQYRKIVQPLADLRKLAKNIDPNNSTDILDEASGNLARRLTSNAASKVQIKKVLQQLDEATSEKGATLRETQDLMDAYNVVSKYYNIAGGTSLEGINMRSMMKSLKMSGVSDRVLEILDEYGGTTSAVKRQKLLDLLDEASSSK